MSSIDVPRRPHARRDARDRRGDLRARSSSRARTRRRPCSTWSGAEHFPDDVVEDLRRYKTRGGSVKVNWVLSEPPRYEGVVRRGPATCCCARAWRSARRSTTSSARGRTPCRGRAVGGAVPRGRGADDDRRDAHRRRLDGRDDVHPVRARTTRRAGRRARASAYGAALPATCSRERAPNVKDAVSTTRCSRRRTSSGSSGCVGGSIFQGEQGLDQMAFMRPTPALAQYATPVDGLYLCGAGTHPGGGVMAARRAQRGQADPARPALAEAAAVPSRGGLREARGRRSELASSRSRPSSRPRAALRRGGPDPARGEGRARGRASADDDVARIKSEAMAAGLARRPARASSTAARAGRSSSGCWSRSSSGARPTRCRGTSRPPTTCSASGSPEQIDRWLRPALRGELHDAYAVTEEHAGSDPSGIATTRASGATAAG